MHELNWNKSVWVCVCRRLAERLAKFVCVWKCCFSTGPTSYTFLQTKRTKRSWMCGVWLVSLSLLLYIHYSDSLFPLIYLYLRDCICIVEQQFRAHFRDRPYRWESDRERERKRDRERKTSSVCVCLWWDWFSLVWVMFVMLTGSIRHRSSVCSVCVCVCALSVHTNKLVNLVNVPWEDFLQLLTQMLYSIGFAVNILTHFSC